MLVFNNIFIFNKTVACSLRFYIFLIKLFWRVLNYFVKKFRSFKYKKFRVKKYFARVEQFFFFFRNIKYNYCFDKILLIYNSSGFNNRIYNLNKLDILFELLIFFEFIYL